MKKFKCFIDFDKEEKWLHEMAKEGYELEKVCFGYKFCCALPKDSTIRIDYRTFKKQEDFIDYCNLFGDSGWEHIAGSRKSGAQYFKKVDENSQGDIFSDAISKAGKYKRLSDMCGKLTFLYLMLFVSVFYGGSFNVNSILNPKLLYFTPGLWERTGAAFWGGFLFETPFVVLRGFVFVIPLSVILYVYLLFKARLLYNKQKKNNDISAS